MDDLIKALTILRKYGNSNYPTHCEHDILMVPGIDWGAITEEDQFQLDQLGFFYSTEYDCIISYRFGAS